MAETSDLPLKYRLFLAAYRFRRAGAAPSPLKKPLAEARLALVTTAGLRPPGTPDFDPEARGGDTSFRVIPDDAALAGLALQQRSELFDHAGAEEDRNLAFPRDRLRELVAAGEVGEAAPRHLSFMGSITAPGRLTKDTAPRAAEVLVEDRVDAALLVPL